MSVWVAVVIKFSLIMRDGWVLIDRSGWWREGGAFVGQLVTERVRCKDFRRLTELKERGEFGGGHAEICRKRPHISAENLLRLY